MKLLWLAAISLLISYVAIAYLSGEWKPFHWKVESQAWAFLGEVTFLLLFLVFRRRLNKD